MLGASSVTVASCAGMICIVYMYMCDMFDVRSADKTCRPKVKVRTTPAS